MIRLEKESKMMSESLDQAEELLSEYLPRLSTGTLSEYWHRWLFADILRREARDLIDEAGGVDAEADVQANTKSDETAK